MKHGRGKITYHNEEEEVFEGEFKEDQKHGKGVLSSKNQYFEAHYIDGVKHGAYRKKIGSDYEEEGEYKDDGLHGHVKITKGEHKATYRYENGDKV
jgi:hypothetical protein